MTLEEAIVEVYERTDEPSDLNPYTAGVIDIATEGAQKIQAALNQAQRVISTWKFADGRRIRFNCTRGECTVYSAYPSVTILGWDGARTLTWAVAGAAADAYRLGVLELNGSEYLILSSTAVSCVIDTVLTADPSGLIGNVRFSRYAPNISTGWVAPEYINPFEFIDLSSKTAISRGTGKSTFTSGIMSAGAPSEWNLDGKFVVFNSAPQEVAYYLMRYNKYPTPCTALSDEFELPEAFHEAVVQWACWWSYRRAGENSSAYAQLRTLSDLMNVLRTEADFDQDGRSGRVTYED